MTGIFSSAIIRCFTHRSPPRSKFLFLCERKVFSGCTDTASHTKIQQLFSLLTALGIIERVFHERNVKINNVVVLPHACLCATPKHSHLQEVVVRKFVQKGPFKQAVYVT